MKYQYHDLSESQFENLTIAVCRELLGVGVQGFAPGKDGGRDARFNGRAQNYPSRADSWKGLIIIQAKHTNGINVKFSDPDFFENNSSVINKEIPRIKNLVESGGIDYYILFSNRKLTGNANENIIKYISKGTGLKTSKIAILGIEAIEGYLKYYPKIEETVDINPFDNPLLVEPDELAQIIVSFRNNKNILSEIKENQQIKKIKEIKRIGFNNKNSQNNLSAEYGEVIKLDMSLYYDEISNFLSQPENNHLKHMYNELTEEFSLGIIAHKREYHSFDQILNYLYYLLIRRDNDLKRNKKLTRIFLHYMYYYCDIGDNA